MSTEDERIAEILRINAEIDAAGEADAEDDRLAMERIAKAARSGELGDDWRRMQQRADLEETTLEAAFTGGDDSREAEALRTASAARLSRLQDEISRDEGLKRRLGELDAMHAATLARANELLARIEGREA
ncbi:hypothetical protein ACWKWP_01750 [Agromyces soli]